MHSSFSRCLRNLLRLTLRMTGQTVPSPIVLLIFLILYNSRMTTIAAQPLRPCCPAFFGWSLWNPLSMERACALHTPSWCSTPSTEHHRSGLLTRGIHTPCLSDCYRWSIPRSCNCCAEDYNPLPLHCRGPGLSTPFRRYPSSLQYHHLGVGITLAFPCSQFVRPLTILTYLLPYMNRYHTSKR
jgi:hypothetical protein